MDNTIEPFRLLVCLVSVLCRTGCLPSTCCCGRCSTTYCLTTSVLSALVVALATVGLALFVIAPAIGNDEIHGTTVAFTQINISNPRDNFFDMSAQVTLGNLKPLGGTIEGEIVLRACCCQILAHTRGLLALSSETCALRWFKASFAVRSMALVQRCP